MKKIFFYMLLVMSLQNGFAQIIPTLPTKPQVVTPKPKTVVKTKIIYRDKPAEKHTLDGNSLEASKCEEQTILAWKNNSPDNIEYQNWMHDQSNLAAWAAQRKLIQMSLSNCRQYFSQSEVDAYNKKIQDFTNLINKN